MIPSIYKYPVLFLLLLTFLGNSAGQLRDAPISSEIQLAEAICSSQTATDATTLLKAHPNLITVRLWYQLKDQAAAAYYSSSPQRSLEIYDALLQVARYLESPNLLAKTYYNLGRTYSGMTRLREAG